MLHSFSEDLGANPISSDETATQVNAENTLIITHDLRSSEVYRNFIVLACAIPEIQIMSKKADVLVIQAGNNANFVGSHMWNSREEVNAMCDDESISSTYFHSGSTRRFPRCIMIEAPENLGALDVADVSSASAGSIWNGNTKTVQAAPQKEMPSSLASNMSR